MDKTFYNEIAEIKADIKESFEHFDKQYSNIIGILNDISKRFDEEDKDERKQN